MSRFSELNFHPVQNKQSKDLRVQFLTFDNPLVGVYLGKTQGKFGDNFKFFDLVEEKEVTSAL